MKYSWLFFDADDTLFDYPKAESGALEMTFLDMGLSYLPDTLATYQVFNQQVWREFEQGKISALDLRIQRFNRLFDHLHLGVDLEAFSQRYLVNLSRESGLIDGADRLLTNLSGHYRMGLITNGLPEVQRPRLAASGIARFFEFVAISEELGVAKPDPRFFTIALDMAGHPDPRSVLVIGDSVNSDIRGGVESGLDALWYNPAAKAVDPRWPVVQDCRSLEEIFHFLLPEN
jgi:YjjG family noncanonical pyrimidine nucleotidase